MTVREPAPAKVNLLLEVGHRRADGLHGLCSLFASIDLADDVAVEEAAKDELVCPDVSGPNLAATALERFRAAVPGVLGPVRVVIEKRIPVAAGLGGGSADAAAVLRAADRLAGHPLGPDALRVIAADIGSDVPSQVTPRHALVTGVGERIEPVDLPAMALVLVPDAEGLDTGTVYAEADRIAATRDGLDPDGARRLAGAPLAELAAGLENDLEAAALSLRPDLATRLDAVLATGALAAQVTGSGPTVFGVFADVADAQAAAERVAGALAVRVRPPSRA